MAPDTENFDISSLNYEDFLLYFFTNPNSQKWDENAAGEQYWMSEIKQPQNIVSYLTRMCVGFGELAKNIPIETLDAGLVGMLAPAYFLLQSTLWSDSVPLNERTRCVDSMYRVFADFVCVSSVKVLPGSFYMWWDHICTAFWFDQTYHKKLAGEHYADLGSHDKKLVDAMFETLSKILVLDDDRTRGCALHGLGHLYHPGVTLLVQQFIDSLPEASKTTESLHWLEQCRDGKVM